MPKLKPIGIEQKGCSDMKKTLFTVILLLCAGTLCSCKANWFGDTIDVPWYLIVLPILLIMVVSYVILMRRTYVCPRCKTEFKPKWYQLFVCLHINGKRVAKCPECGRKGLCERKR